MYVRSKIPKVFQSPETKEKAGAHHARRMAGNSLIQTRKDTKEINLTYFKRSNLIVGQI